MHFVNLKFFYQYQPYKFINEIYEEIRKEFDLPKLEDLNNILQGQSVQPPYKINQRVQAFYMDDLLSDFSVSAVEGLKEKKLFQIRFPFREDSKEFVSIFLSWQGEEVLNMTVTLPSRYSDAPANKIIGLFKILVKERQMNPRSLNFIFEGWLVENGAMKWVSDKYLTSWIWSDDRQGYLHKSESF